MIAAQPYVSIDVALLLLRVTFGVTLALHGYGKFFTGGRIPGTARWFDSIGMRPGKTMALMAASTEVAAGLAFAIGFLTPIASAGFVALMLVAGWTVHRDNGFFIVRDGWEYNMILAVGTVTIAMTGAGRFSLDRLFDLESSFSGFRGLAMSAGLGIAGGVGLLAAVYRPPAKETLDTLETVETVETLETLEPVEEAEATEATDDS